MHLLPRMNVMLDCICMGPVDVPGTRRKRQIRNEKISPTVVEPTTLRFLVWCSTDWDTQALMTDVLLNWYLNIHVFPIPLYTLVYVRGWWRTTYFDLYMYFIGMYLYWWNSKNDAQVLCLFSTSKTPPNILTDLEKCTVMFCMLKANTGKMWQNKPAWAKPRSNCYQSIIHFRDNRK